MTSSDSSTTTASGGPRLVSAWWRAGAYGCLLLLALAATAGVSMYEQFRAQVVHLQAQLHTVPQIRFICILLDAQHAPALLVTQDPLEGALQLQRLNAVSEGREDSMQLWVLPQSGTPRSLGVLTSKAKTLRLPATATALAGAHQLAISVEVKGGVPESSGPRLPYLFTGPLVQKAL
ncbi:MAG: anti-sigma factor [Rhodoferax sp.]|nr:anti-sigma factor [Rhodoferax sp.]